MTPTRRAVSDALWAMCAADSMSMPVHWYYDVDDIWRDFGGWISGFRSPKDRHPSSILSLSNTAGSGRTAWASGARRPDVVGSVILHDKLDLWKSSDGSVHYHQGLQAGDNTLNVLCSLRAARSLVAGRFSDVSRPDARAAVLADYVSFLTTAGSHRDTYAESSHRSFFCSWQDGRPTEPRQVLAFAENRCRQLMSSSSPDSQLDAIGCLPMILPFVLLSASANQEQAVGVTSTGSGEFSDNVVDSDPPESGLQVSAAVEFVKLTHPHPRVPRYVSIYSQALHAVLGGAGVRQQAEHALRTLDAWETCQTFIRKAARFPLRSDEGLRVHQSAVHQLGLACYTKGALSSLFYLAHEFAADLPGGILANANCGGENCNRGAALGALLGAAGAYGGAGVPQDWRDELRDAREFIPHILQDI